MVEDTEDYDYNKDGNFNILDVTFIANKIKELDQNEDGTVDSQDVIQILGESFTNILNNFPDLSQELKTTLCYNFRKVVSFIAKINFFDVNKDGKLSKEDLDELLSQLYLE